MFTLRLNPNNNGLLLANINNPFIADYPEFCEVLADGTKRECLDYASEYWSENYIQDENQFLLQLK